MEWSEIESNVTLRFMHGGSFKKVRERTVYVGGQCRTFTIDVDELCWFFLEEMAKKCDKYTKIEKIYYLKPNMNLDTGLVSVYNDSEVLEMAKILMKSRCLDVFVLHGVDKPEIVEEVILDDCSCRKKLTPRRKVVKRGEGSSAVRVESERVGSKRIESEVEGQGDGVLGGKRADSERVGGKGVDNEKQDDNPPFVSTQESIASPTLHRTSPTTVQKKQSTTPKKKVVPPTRSSPRLHKHTDNIKQSEHFPELSKGATQKTTSLPDSTPQPKPTESLQPSKTPQKSSKNTTPQHFKEAEPTQPQQNSKGKSPVEVFLPQSYQEDDELPLDYHDWYDSRPESPIPLNELLSEPESEDLDSEYEPESDSDDVVLEPDELVDEEGLIEEPEANEDDVVVEDIPYADSDDDELQIARERVKKRKEELKKLTQQLRRQAEKGLLGGGSKLPRSREPLDTDQRRGDAHSDYENSQDEVHTPTDSDEEEGTGRLRRSAGLLVTEDTDWSTFQWQVGQIFRNREAFRAAVASFAVSQGRNLYFTNSNMNRQQRMVARCSRGCPFRIYGSWDSRRAVFVLKSLNNEHTCCRNMDKNKQLKSSWLVKQFLEIFKSRPHWPAREIVETVRLNYKMVIKRTLAYKVKYMAHRLLHGSMKEHYNKIGSYIAALSKASPESHFVLCTTPPKKEGEPPVFQRLFIGFHGLKVGWIEGCRKLLCVDACFLKTFLGGQLMVAVGRDANEQMYPVCWAVVEGENNSSWEWFVTEMSSFLELGQGEALTLISDEHQALLGAVAKVLPNCEHRHCARHIFAHWHKYFRGEDFKLMFWTAAKSYNMADFDDAMAELAKESSAAEQAFRGYTPELFCRAFFNVGTKVDVVVNNLAETFNGYIVNSRTKHLIYMLEDIRSNLMQRIVVKRMEMEKNKRELCPRVQTKLEHEKNLAAICRPIPSTTTKFEVRYYMDCYLVDLEDRSCTCNRWDLTGIPCCHAISCIYFCYQEAEDYVHEYYKKDTYMRSYTVSIPPIQGERHWPKVNQPLQPPPIKVGPGRPRKNRRRDPYEDPKKPGKLSKHGVQMTCSICKSTSHNKRRCPDKGKQPSASTQQPPSKRRRGTSVQEAATTEASSAHHDNTAQPTRTGRGGRVIRTGVGSRGGNRGGRAPSSQGGRGQHGNEGQAGRGRGRGGRGRGRGPQGVGVYVDERGSSFINVPGQRGGAIELTQVSVNPSAPRGSQPSTAS